MASFIFKAPEDVLKYILKVQGEKKSEKGLTQYSQSLTICTIIREHKQMKEIKSNKQ